MPDAEKAKERKRRYLRRQKVVKYGEEFADTDMRGRHGNHARGERSARWQRGRLVTSHGYIAIRVPSDHPHAWGGKPGSSHRYAYEHVVVMTNAIGRRLAENEVVHHRDGDKQNNNLSNLELTTIAEHSRHHYPEREVDHLGRFR